MRLLAAFVLALAAGVAPSALAPASQNSLDEFMNQVLARRDDNWKKLQQYILEEDERFLVTGPDGSPLFGFRRDYTWFIRDGYFIRSPLSFNGVSIGEDERRAYEGRWLQREKRREERAAKRAAEEGANDDREQREITVSPTGVEMDIVSSTLEPRFVSAAYFLRFKFDPGHYALAGREQRGGREVLKIEYYPSKLFTEGRTKPDKRVREGDEDIEEKMNKVSLVTLWIDREARQIVEYTFENVGMEFMPGRSLMRIEELRASMQMSQPFPDVWLPGTIEMRFGLTTALGPLAARYDVRYHDYREAAVKSTIRPPG